MSAPSGEPRRNVECKARDPQPDRSLAVCSELGAADHGLLRQRDTYFDIGRGGRLKLREQAPGGAALIGYERTDAPGERESRYRIAPVADPAALTEVLGATLGVRLVVDKRRRLFLWRSVRIHLDEVDGLGTFVELEAVAPPDSDLRPERALVAQLRERLGITDDRLVAVGYADLVAAAGADARNAS